MFITLTKMQAQQTNNVSIPTELLPIELQNANPEYLAHLITIGHKIITIKENKDKNNKDNKNSASIVILGQIGEDTIRKIYEKKFSIENVSKQGRTGDILIRRKNVDPTKPFRQAILIEIKNYSAPVGTNEIEKFYRDLSANAAIGGGIFISLNTKIVGFDSNLQFIKRGDTPVIFLSLDWISEFTSIDELVTLTADIIWTHLDSRFIVDTEVFQKLSSKLTKLNDCINGLSLNRTYINETRLILDKQLTKIYETSYETEIAMRSVINSITKTLAKGSFEDVQNNLNGTSNSKTYKHDEYLEGFMSLVDSHFPDSLYNTNNNHSELVNLVIEKFCNNDITLIPIKKGIIFKNSHVKITVLLLKSRTDIQYVSHKNILSCPNWASCNNGIITFPLDANSTRRETLMDIEKTCF